MQERGVFRQMTEPFLFENFLCTRKAQQFSHLLLMMQSLPAEMYKFETVASHGSRAAFVLANTGASASAKICSAA
jgi:hypothetical protein